MHFLFGSVLHRQLDVANPVSILPLTPFVIFFTKSLSPRMWGRFMLLAAASILSPTSPSPAFDLTTYFPIFLYLAACIVIPAGAIIGADVIGPRKRTAVKLMPYESGMDPIGEAMHKYDVKFYLIAILFLVFDVELLFLYPWAVIAYGPEGDPAWRAAFGRDRFLRDAGFHRDPGGGLRLRLAEGGLPMAVRPNENFLISKLDWLANYVRANSLWPMPFATACCGIELMATASSRYDHRPLRFRSHALHAATMRPDDRRRPRGHENAAGDAAHLAANAGAEMVHLDGSVRLQRRRLRHLRGRSGNRSLHPGGYLCAGLPAAAGAIDPVGHRLAGTSEADRHAYRHGISRAGPEPEEPQAAGAANSPPEQVVAPGNFQTATREWDK